MVLIGRASSVADNFVDIAEQASYVVTGELREFSDASHQASDPASSVARSRRSRPRS
jgi:hypothetical protein